MACASQLPTRRWRSWGGGDEAHRYKILVDRDSAFPRLRVVLAPEGGFKQSKPPLGDRWKMIRIGRDTGLPESKLPATECEWEKVEGQPAIEIELPRELRLTRQHQPVGQPSTSTGPRPAPVTLPGAAVARVKERA